jgi:hypothetical protein
MRSTEHDWLNGQPARKEQSGALRTVKFVGRETGRVDQPRHGGEVDLPEGLDHIAVQKNATGPANLGNLFERLKDAGFIVGSHNGDEPRFWPDRVCELVKIDKAILRDVQPCHFEIFVLFQLLKRIQNRVVLRFV